MYTLSIYVTGLDSLCAPFLALNFNNEGTLTKMCMQSVHKCLNTAQYYCLLLSSSGICLSVFLHLEVPAQVFSERQLTDYAGYVSLYSVYDVHCQEMFVYGHQLPQAWHVGLIPNDPCTFTLWYCVNTHKHIHCVCRVLGSVFTDDSIP